MMVHICNPSYLGGRDRRTGVWCLPGQMHKTLSEKRSKSKRTGAVAYVAEHLPSKLKVLSSMSSTVTHKKDIKKVLNK
jgi:hypothetical protein